MRLRTGYPVAAMAAIAAVAALLLFSGCGGDDQDESCRELVPGAELQGCNLKRASIKHVDLTGAHLEGADLSHAKLNGSGLAKADLTDANLQGADLTGATLEAAKLSDALVKGAVLRGADVEGASLEGAKGVEQAMLEGVKGLSDATLAKALGVSAGQLPVFLSNHHVWLEKPGIVRKSADAVCAGGSVSEAPAEPNGTLAVVGGAHLANASYSPPGGWQPVARRYLARVACMRAAVTVVESCAYDRGPVDRAERDYAITVRAARSGSEVATTTLAGGYPSACPATLYTFGGGEPHVWGTPPSDGAVDNWLDQWRWP